MKKEILKDEYGNAWINWCDYCQKPSLSIVRPGKVQCDECEEYFT